MYKIVKKNNYLNKNKLTKDCIDIINKFKTNCNKKRCICELHNYLYNLIEFYPFLVSFFIKENSNYKFCWNWAMYQSALSTIS